MGKAPMKKRYLKIEDANAEAFFGADNAMFESSIERIAGHDPRLLTVFRNVRLRYLDEVDGSSVKQS